MLARFILSHLKRFLFNEHAALQNASLPQKDFMANTRIQQEILTNTMPSWKSTQKVVDDTIGGEIGVPFFFQ